MELLAKSEDARHRLPSVSLKQHIEDCLIIFEFLRIAFPKVVEISSMNADFWEVLRMAIVFHDVGKAHREFQRLLRKRSNSWNSQRHELFSVPFVSRLKVDNSEIRELIKLAIAGHHKDYDSLAQKLDYYDTGDSFGMLETAEDFRSFVDEFNENVQSESVYDILKEFGIELSGVEPMRLDRLIRGYIKNPARLKGKNYIALMMLVGGLKWCDHLGSSQLRELKFLQNDDFLFLNRQQQALEEIGRDFYSHQMDCAAGKGNIILVAPTGSGKTESALLWIKNQLSISGQGRVFYVLPFTASINAMFERLSGAFGQSTEKVGMLHGKLRDYLNDYFDSLQYSVKEKRETVEAIKNKFRSVFTPLKVVTPFQLLKHIFGLKGYEQGIFEMAGSYLIFDEIHAYSPQVFAQIRVLLEFATKWLGVKVLIMTATMPKFMLRELEDSVGDFEIVRADEKLYEKLTRHRIVLKKGFLYDSIEAITSQLSLGASTH